MAAGGSRLGRVYERKALRTVFKQLKIKELPPPTGYGAPPVAQSVFAGRPAVLRYLRSFGGGTAPPRAYARARVGEEGGSKTAKTAQGGGHGFARTPMNTAPSRRSSRVTPSRPAPSTIAS